MQKFQSQELVDLVGIVPPPAQMAFDDGFDTLSLDVSAREASGIKQDLPDVIRQLIAVPDPEMRKLVSAEEQALQMKAR